MKSFELVSFDEALIDSTGGNDKILQSDYCMNGALPIIDQGEDFIGGYTDDLSLKYSNQLPCIVFGDHTKILKYVDFDFALGADGTKILLTKNEFDPKFIFYYLHTFRFPPNVGYSRHFKFLKEIKIPKLDLNYQIKCRNILDKADSIRKKRQESIRLADEFLRSTFLDMFGDPVKNNSRHPLCQLGKASSKVTDGEHLNPELVNFGQPLIMAKDIREDYIDFTQEKFVSEDNYLKYTRKCNPEFGDLVLVSRGATIGRCTTIKTHRQFCLMGSVILIKSSSILNSYYLEWLFKHPGFYESLIKVSGSSAQQAIYIANLTELEIPLPLIELQNNFGSIVMKTDKVKYKYQSFLSESENLFNSLMQRAFRGEL